MGARAETSSSASFTVKEEWCEDKMHHCAKNQRAYDSMSTKKKNRPLTLRDLLAVIYRQWLDPTVVAINDYALTAHTTAMKRMREACGRIDRNRQYGKYPLKGFWRDGIPVDVVGGCCSTKVSSMNVSLASRRVEDPALTLDTDPVIERYASCTASYLKKNQEFQ